MGSETCMTARESRTDRNYSLTTRHSLPPILRHHLLYHPLSLEGPGLTLRTTIRRLGAKSTENQWEKYNNASDKITQPWMASVRASKIEIHAE